MSNETPISDDAYKRSFAHIRPVCEMYERMQKLERETNELRAALEGRTVSCVCGGQEKIDELKAQLAAAEAKANRVCKWTVSTYSHLGYPQWYNTDCGKVNENRDNGTNCRFCGGRIDGEKE